MSFLECRTLVVIDCCYKMPPRRRSKRASQECDERLSIAETIAGLANSIEQPAFSPVGAITRQNSYDKSPANFSELPSVVVEEVVGSADLPVSLHSLPLQSRSVSVDGIANTADLGHNDIPTHKLRSQLQFCVQNQPSLGNASDVTSQSQLSSTFTTPGSSENITCKETDHLHPDTAGCSVSVSFNSDTVFSAVLMGWNPPVLASCPSANIEPVSVADIYSPLSALRTVEPANNNSGVEVLKLPLVLEPTSDGTWQLIPMSASAAFGTSTLPNTECVIPTVAQQSEHTGPGIHQFSSNNMAQAGVGSSSSGLITAVDNSQLQLHSLGSLSVLGSYYNGSGGCASGLSSTVAAGPRQELSSVVSSVSCTGCFTSKSSVPSSLSSSTGEDVVGGSSVLGSLSALRNYYNRISRSVVIQSSSSTVTDVQTSTSVVNVASVGNNESSCADALQSKIPAVSVSVCNDQVVQPVSCINDVSAARHFSVQTNLNMKLIPDADEKSSLRNSGRVLPAVSVDHCRKSSDSANKQLFTESQSNLDRSTAAVAPFTDGGCERRRSCELLRHLPLKKRQKVSTDVHCEVEQNGCQRRSSDELEDEQSVNDHDKNVTIDAADVLLSEETVTREQPLTADVAVPGTRNVISLCQSC